MFVKLIDLIAIHLHVLLQKIVLRAILAKARAKQGK
jgi:hypothetical protein